jgi:hypothetical protein
MMALLYQADHAGLNQIGMTLRLTTTRVTAHLGQPTSIGFSPLFYADALKNRALSTGHKIDHSSNLEPPLRFANPLGLTIFDGNQAIKRAWIHDKQPTWTGRQKSALPIDFVGLYGLCELHLGHEPTTGTRFQPRQDGETSRNVARM